MISVISARLGVLLAIYTSIRPKLLSQGPAAHKEAIRYHSIPFRHVLLCRQNLMCPSHPIATPRDGLRWFRQVLGCVGLSAAAIIWKADSDVQ